jgi:hypothetical protein
VHPIRGGFNDVRHPASFHFGVDVEAPNEARVYAVISGRLTRFAHIGTGLDEHFDLGRYQYWHVTPFSWLNGRRVARGQWIGRVARGFRHVHLSEIVPGCGVIDPRRPGGILEDPLNREAPTIGAISAFRADAAAYAPFPPTATPSAQAGSVWTVVDDTGPVGDLSTPILPSQLSGVVDFRAPVSDTPLFATKIYRQQPLMVAGVRGYIAAYGNPNDRLSPFAVAFDGVRLIAQSRFYSVFAFGTQRINGCFYSGTKLCSTSYVIHTAGRGLSTSALPDGSYDYCIQAVTINDVSARRCIPITIQNHAALANVPPHRTAVASTSTLLPSMVRGGYGLAATTTSDGSILVLGGYGQPSGWLRTVERFSISRGRWSLLPPLPSARFAAAAGVGPYGGVYAISGYTPTLGDTRSVEILDPHTLRWAAAASIPTARRYLAAVSTSRRIYAIGGYNTESGAVSETDVYAPTHNRWTRVAPLPIPTAGAAAAAGRDGRIYVFGGWDDANGILGRTQIYDPTTNSWTLGADMPINREAAAAATAANGCIYVLGGDTIQNGSPTALSEVDVYDPTTNTWTTAPPMLQARRSLAAAAGPTDIYAIGGADQNDNALSSLESFPPLTTSC